MSYDRDPVTSRLLGGEQLGGLAAAGRLLPGHRGNAHVNASTVFRWVTKGCKAADGSAVRLEAARVGGRWLTSREAVARFAAALSAPPAPAADVRSQAQRAQANARVDRELDRLGI